jgi:hypothetical protein
MPVDQAKWHNLLTQTQDLVQLVGGEGGARDEENDRAARASKRTYADF